MSIYDHTHSPEHVQTGSHAGFADEQYEPAEPHEFSPEEEAAMYAAYVRDCRIRELASRYARVCHSFSSDGRRSGWYTAEVFDADGTKYPAGKYRSRDAGWAAADALVWELAEAEYAAESAPAYVASPVLMDIPCQSCGAAILSDGGTLCSRCQRVAAA